ncbi:hypothetical protein KP509_35G046200 [Ceratopteris richardii]|uniref:Uncharacterized protein n=1 Tax=Ceratopteris richardii TaxID=49495 RepID=A0A8T2QHR4_CERRI|nr:hypothetical protein KP509_35G046200 [Ceratopteris richardii]
MHSLLQVKNMEFYSIILNFKEFGDVWSSRNSGGNNLYSIPKKGSLIINNRQRGLTISLIKMHNLITIMAPWVLWMRMIFSCLGDVHESAFLVKLNTGALLAPQWN